MERINISMKRWGILITYLGLFGLLIYGYQTNHYVERNLNNLISATQVKVTQLISPHAKTDQNSHKAGKWNQPQAKLYLELGNDELTQATKEAVANWNQTGVFHFTITTNRDQADVIVTTMQNSSNQAAGLTKMRINSLTHYFVGGTMYLNAAYLLNPMYQYSYQQVVNTAEHELGHVIGLNHTNEISVMQPRGSNFTIQPRDVNQVKQMYQKSGSKWSAFCLLN